MKKIVLGLMAIIALSGFAPADNAVYITREAHVWFLSKARLENIEGHSHQGQSILNTNTGEIAFSIQIKSFEFKKELMQEHFNERYMESDKYPKATFKGNITNIGSLNLEKKGTYKAIVEGDLTMHGETKHIKTTANVVSDGSSISATSVFNIALADYKIEIPAQKADNIAPNLDITIEATYKPKE